MRQQSKPSLKDQLLTELLVRFVDQICIPGKTDVTQDELIYDICGYMLHSRSQVMIVLFASLFWKPKNQNYSKILRPLIILFLVRMVN